MTLEQILLLSFIQGFTEFLPISSSGHLILIPSLCGWKDQGLMMDVAAHIGTLGSVLVYFRKDVASLFKGLFSLLKGESNENSRLLINLIVATIPVVIIGFLFDNVIRDIFRNVVIVAWVGIIFGVILYIADKYGSLIETIADTSLKRALYFGLAQSMALVNGVSRAGICITMGRFMNYKRTDAARFAFLMSIPTITAAGTLKGYHLFKINNFAILNDALMMIAFSFVFGLMAIAFMMYWLQRSTLTPFVIYRLLLGCFLLVSVYGGFMRCSPLL